MLARENARLTLRHGPPGIRRPRLAIPRRNVSGSALRIRDRSSGCRRTRALLDISSGKLGMNLTRAPIDLFHAARRHNDLLTGQPVASVDHHITDHPSLIVDNESSTCPISRSRAAMANLFKALVLRVRLAEPSSCETLARPDFMCSVQSPERPLAICGLFLTSCRVSGVSTLRVVQSTLLIDVEIVILFGLNQPPMFMTMPRTIQCSSNKNSSTWPISPSAAPTEKPYRSFAVRSMRQMHHKQTCCSMEGSKGGATGVIR